MVLQAQYSFDATLLVNHDKDESLSEIRLKITEVTGPFRKVAVTEDHCLGASCHAIGPDFPVANLRLDVLNDN